MRISLVNGKLVQVCEPYQLEERMTSRMTDSLRRNGQGELDRRENYGAPGASVADEYGRITINTPSNITVHPK